MIQELVENKDKAKLKKISQQFLQNATYLLRFGAHNDTGVCWKVFVGRFWLQIQSYELETRNIENGTAR